MARKTAGRQRVEMKKIEKEEALQVTFSKRRSGVFKKASELAILCGAEVVIIVFSPAGRPYTFGSPDVETVAQRFLTGNPVRPTDPYMNRGVLVRQLVREYTDITAVRDMEKTRLRELKKAVKESRVLDIEALGAEELEQVLGSMEELKGRLVAHLDHLKYMDSMSSHDHLVNPTSHEQATDIHGHPMAQYGGGNPMGSNYEFVSLMGHMNPGPDHHHHFNPSGQHANDMTGSMGFNDGTMYVGSFGFQHGESSSTNANVVVPGRASDQPPFGPSSDVGFHPYDNH